MKKYLFLIFMLAGTLVYGQNNQDTIVVNVLKGGRFNTVPATYTGVIKIYDTLEFRDGTKMWTAAAGPSSSDHYRDGEVTVSSTTTLVTFTTPFTAGTIYDLYYTELDAIGIDTKATNATKTVNGFTLISLVPTGKGTYFAVKRK